MNRTVLFNYQWPEGVRVVSCLPAMIAMDRQETRVRAVSAVKKEPLGVPSVAGAIRAGLVLSETLLYSRGSRARKDFSYAKFRV